VLVTDNGGEHWTRRLDGREAAQLVLEAAKADGDKRTIRAAKWLVSGGPDKPLLDLLVIDPPRDVVVLIFTNLILLPVLLSYAGVSARAAARSQPAHGNRRFGAIPRKPVLVRSSIFNIEGIGCN
jgi:hypothetical protein